jgi:FkbM family methyltransferase
MKKILYKKSFFYLTIRKFKYWIYLLSTRNALDVFLRGKDNISLRPQVDGIHEEAVTKLIAELSVNGYNDYFVDIGANIGLSSCQNGPSFTHVFCFEPNPLCLNILKTNLMIHLDENKYTIYEFALGKSDEKLDLYIPKNNWGGAFIKDKNCYSKQTLIDKDGFEEFDLKNYIIKEILVKNGREFLSAFFLNLLETNLIRGVIKIDVEGYEDNILKDVLKTLPSSLMPVIIFENWNNQLNLSNIKEQYSNRKIKFKKIHRNTSRFNKNFFEYIKLLIVGEKYCLSDIDNDESFSGDIVVLIE